MVTAKPEQTAQTIGARPEELYLELLAACLTRSLFGYSYVPAAPPRRGYRRAVFNLLSGSLNARGIELMRRVSFDQDDRAAGRDWPRDGETMVGLARLRNLRECIADVIRSGVPGDLLEAGVWRGGATIFMRAALKAYGDQQRLVWVADSFQGLPPPNADRYPADAGDQHWTWSDILAVPLDQVQANFRRFGLLDDQVRFLPGWFQDTLPSAPIDRLAVLRLDGDMYESTKVALDALYPKLSPGGYLIVDDYNHVPGCKAAVDDHRAEHGIDEPMREIDWTAVYWQRGFSSNR
jgi:O-methyltransferase